MNQFGRATAEIFSPLLAGVLMMIIQLQGVILIDVLTFLFAVLSLALVRFPRMELKPAGRNIIAFRKDLTFGKRYILSRKGLRNLLFFQGTVNFIWGMLGALIVPMILSFTTTDRLSAIITIAGTGMLAGSLLMTIWGGPRRRINGVILFELISGICFILMGLRPQFWLVAAGAFGAHLTIAVVFGSNQALWQTQVEPENQGRVFAFQQMFASSASPLAYMIAGPLAEYFFEPWMTGHGKLSQHLNPYLSLGPGRGIGLLLIFLGIIKIMVSALGYLNPRVRQIEDDLPYVNPSETA
jgi:MFS family permease